MGKATLNPLKAKIRAKEFIKQGFNATKTIQKLQPQHSKEVAEVTGSRMLRNVQFVKSVIEELEEQGISNELLDKRLKYILSQNKHLPSALGAILIANKLKQRLPKESTAGDTFNQYNVYLNDPEAMNTRLKEIQDELAKLPSGS